MPGGGSWKSGPTRSPAAQRSGISYLQRVREEFRLIGGTSDKTLTSKELARHWFSLAREDGRFPDTKRRLSREEKQVVALHVSQVFQEMYLKRHGQLGLDEWVHYYLLAESTVSPVKASEQLNPLLKQILITHPRLLEDLQRMFEAADRNKMGLLTVVEIAEMYRRRLWHLKPGNDGKQLSDMELRQGDPWHFARNIVEAMDLNGDDGISYMEFMAYCLGRRTTQVSLHLYDLSNGTAKALSPWLLGEELEGLWHTGVVVYNKEYYFGGEIFYDVPGRTSFGEPTKVVHLGDTLWRQTEMHCFIVDELRPLFTRETYDVVNNNCNHFSDRVAMWLLGKHIPDEVLTQPNFLVSLGATAMRPLLNRYLGNFDKKDNVLEGGDVAATQWLAKDVLPAGMVVTVHPERPHGSSILGIVAATSRPRADADASSAQSDTVLVRYLQVTAPTTCTGSSARLCVEAVPRSQLSAARLDDLGDQGIYEAAMRAIAEACGWEPESDVAGGSSSSRLRGAVSALNHRCVMQSSPRRPSDDLPNHLDEPPLPAAAIPPTRLVARAGPPALSPMSLPHVGDQGATPRELAGRRTGSATGSRQQRTPPVALAKPRVPPTPDLAGLVPCGRASPCLDGEEDPCIPQEVSVSQGSRGPWDLPAKPTQQAKGVTSRSGTSKPESLLRWAAQAALAANAPSSPPSSARQVCERRTFGRNEVPKDVLDQLAISPRDRVVGTPRGRGRPMQRQTANPTGRARTAEPESRAPCRGSPRFWSRESASHSLPPHGRADAFKLPQEAASIDAFKPPPAATCADEEKGEGAPLADVSAFMCPDRSTYAL